MTSTSRIPCLTRAAPTSSMKASIAALQASGLGKGSDSLRYVEGSWRVGIVLLHREVDEHHGPHRVPLLRCRGHRSLRVVRDQSVEEPVRIEELEYFDRGLFVCDPLPLAGGVEGLVGEIDEDVERRAEDHFVSVRR